MRHAVVSDIVLHHLFVFCCFQISDNADVFMKMNLHRVNGVDLLRQPVSRLEFFLLKCSEQSIPYDQKSTIIFIKVEWIRPVMHPVMGRRIKNRLYP